MSSMNRKLDDLMEMVGLLMNNDRGEEATNKIIHGENADENVNPIQKDSHTAALISAGGKPRAAHRKATAAPSSGPIVNTPRDKIKWDNVDWAQTKFFATGEFTVPDGVHMVDVICIGGGGGGRDHYNEGSVGGVGGNSSFGSFIIAHGGKGAHADDTGGEGGKGRTVHGGQGEVTSFCSAGGGAAGETSRPKVRGTTRQALVPGSSTNPFCGGGGSSREKVFCKRTYRRIPMGKSGPGGVDPQAGNGGLYGGGGASVAGRAGGGGGYSRAVVRVQPGQNIHINVGTGGVPYQKGSIPGQGIVVVSWGGPIDPLGKANIYLN